MTIAGDLHSFKGTADGLQDLTGTTGTTLSSLRPGGFALINEKRIDVITQGEMIDKDETVRVVKVEGNRVIVEKTS